MPSELEKVMRRYGWKPDVPDFRDLKFSLPAMRTFPESMDLMSPFVPVRNQLEIGSCQSESVAGEYMFSCVKKGMLDRFVPSPMFLYYVVRMIEGTVDSDSGASLRDTIKAIAKYGVCHEELWPYDTSKFKKKPSMAAFKDAKKHQAVKYERLNPTVTEMKNCLTNGHSFVFGIPVYESFESESVAKTGMVLMPGAMEAMLGGHAMRCVGYNDAIGCYKVQNSWGDSWGDKGCCHIPYRYMLTMASDLWVITAVEG